MSFLYIISYSLNTHLIDGYLIEPYKAFALWHSLINENGIDILHICQANEFVDGSLANGKIASKLKVK